ncbi:MAG: hypothetical protein M0C28_11460 [Candidatus Moduliflexus flocculans]|nr:hypothetical protein [Candidatus Moduliflexus flocculans]
MTAEAKELRRQAATRRSRSRSGSTPTRTSPACESIRDAVGAKVAGSASTPTRAGPCPRPIYAPAQDGAARHPVLRAARPGLGHRPACATVRRAQSPIPIMADEALLRPGRRDQAHQGRGLRHRSTSSS